MDATSRPRTSYSKLPQEVTYLLVYYRNEKPSHLHHFFLLPPQTRKEKERIRLQLRYLRDVEQNNPQTFNYLLAESITFFLETPLEYLEFLNPEYLTETILDMSNQRSKAAKASLGFFEDDDDDDSFDGAGFTTETAPHSGSKKKLSSPALKAKGKMTISAGTIILLSSLFFNLSHLILFSCLF